MVKSKLHKIIMVQSILHEVVQSNSVFQVRVKGKESIRNLKESVEVDVFIIIIF